jgi:hypothetical protein
VTPRPRGVKPATGRRRAGHWEGVPSMGRRWRRPSHEEATPTGRRGGHSTTSGPPAAGAVTPARLWRAPATDWGSPAMEGTPAMGRWGDGRGRARHGEMRAAAMGWHTGCGEMQAAAMGGCAGHGELGRRPWEGAPAMGRWGRRPWVGAPSMGRGPPAMGRGSSALGREH